MSVGVPAYDPAPLSDPHRISAARRLFVEVPGAAAFDRLSRLAARLVGARHAKVTLFTDQDTVIGGFGLPAGVVGGPALLTGALSAIVVCSAEPLAVPDARRDERIADLPAVTSGQVVAYLGAPLIAASGHVVGALAVYDEAPKSWSDDDRELLRQLAVSVVAELELSAAQSAVGTSRARLDVALEASSIGIWELDLRTGAVFWDERCAAVFGVEGAAQFDSMGELLGRYIHPEDAAALEEAMDLAVTERRELLVETRALRADGQVRWTVSRGRVVFNSRGEAVRVLGTIVDVTDTREQASRRLSAMQRAAAIAEVAAELANTAHLDQLAGVALRGAQVLGAVSSALAVFDTGGGALRLHMTPGIVEAVRRNVDVELPPGGVEIELDDRLPTQYAARHGRRVLLADREEAEARFPAMAEVNAILGAGAVAALPLRIEGRVLGSFVVVWGQRHPFAADDLEVLEALTAQIALTVSRLQADVERAAAVEAMAEANRQLQLLADAGRVLSGTLDVDQQLDQLAHLLVPGLADWCWLMVVDEQGRLEQLAAAHGHPTRGDELGAAVLTVVNALAEKSGPRVVTATGRPVVLPELDYDRMSAAVPGAAPQAALARLNPAAGAIVPLLAGGQTLGALGLFNGAERGPLSAAEVETTVEIGRRTGLALHHARMYGQQRALADALQRSMLTEPPRPEHCEIVVRYVPAAEGAEIGGDWYDAFLQPSGATVLAIGDVVGHDTRAAAAMGQVRGLLRGIAFARGGSPAEVLSELDRAVQGLELDTMATALVARLERDDPRVDEERAASRLGPDQVLLRWASAGHPLPVVVGKDRTVEVLDSAPANLLLGVAPDSPREDHAVVLDRGATVLLYTDGLVERRDRDIDAGTDELVKVLAECGHLSLPDLCDQVLEQMFLPDAEDDVALLAVRLT